MSCRLMAKTINMVNLIIDSFYGMVDLLNLQHCIHKSNMSDYILKHDLLGSRGSYRHTYMSNSFLLNTFLTPSTADSVVDRKAAVWSDLETKQRESDQGQPQNKGQELFSFRGSVHQ